jgi:hypothetical protein
VIAVLAVLMVLSELGFSLGAGLATKINHRRQVKAGHIRDGVWQRHGTA